jgi:hypothetical protein
MIMVGPQFPKIGREFYGDVEGIPENVVGITLRWEELPG